MYKYGVHRMTWGPLFDPNNLGPFFEQAARTGADLVEIRPPDPCILEDTVKTQGWWNDERKGLWFLGALWGVAIASLFVLRRGVR